MRDPSPAGHIAIVTAPLAGHLNPVQALAAGLRRWGWRVSIVHVAAAGRLVTHPAVEFAALAGKGDGIYPDYLAALTRPSGPVGLHRMIRSAAAMTDLLLSEAPPVMARIGATAVLADAVEPAGPLIARHLGLPCAIAVTGLPLLRDDLVPPPYVGWRARTDAWGRFRNRAGHAVAQRLMRPVEAVMEARRREWRLAGGAAMPAVHVAQCPRALDFPRRDLPAQFHYGSPWRLPEESVAALPRDGRPLVFCSLGTLQGSRVGLFAAMAAACAAIGARAVIGHGGGLTREQEAALPGDPLVRAFWPQREVLEQCAAAILHGGFNSVLDALAAGVPLMLLPIGFEQPGTAARVAHVGAGRILSPHRLAVGSLARSLGELLEDGRYRRAAGRMARAMGAQEGADRAAAIIDAALTSRA